MRLNAIVLCCLVGCLAIEHRETRADQPHMVVFLSDDHTLADSSVYGSTEIETPNMARLASAGMTFDQAFVASPSCAPSRAALLTGLMPARNGAEANHSRPHAELKKLPAYLQGLGYEVVSFGKVGHYIQTPEYGFDLAKHFTYHDDVAVAEACKWLRDRRSDKPLCLFVGTNWPHVPWPEANEYTPDQVQIPHRHVDTPETRVARTRYLQAIRTMDRELGEVYDTAREVLGESTLFVHTSDHGAQWPFAKWTLYDDGIRTPLIVTWPGNVAAGVRTDAMVSWVDILPTLVEAAGGKPDLTLDGRSMLPVLKGETDSHREAVYTVHTGDGNMNVYPSRSMRTSNWKYIRNLHPEFRFSTHVVKAPSDTRYWPSWVEKAKHDEAAASLVQAYQSRPGEELYDLNSDPHERHNLASDPACQARLVTMRESLSEWLQTQEDKERVIGMPELMPVAASNRPNVITVFIDDMGWADLSCFGGSQVETTNIDRLASEGIRLTQFYVNSPICSPSRTALTTGQYPARHRITSFLADRQANQNRGMAQWLDVGAPTLARMMNHAGYTCGHFGKWHLGGQRDVGDAPLITEYGFDASLTNFEGLGPRVLPLKDAYDGKPAQPHALGSDRLGRGPIEWEDRSRVTTRFVDAAVKFIDSASENGKPFYINLWPDDVHSPFFPPQGTRGDGEKRTLYYSVLKAMDDQLGVLFERIRQDPKLRNNTMILLASDNGPEPGAGSAGVLRGHKGELWEGGIRSPLIVWAPGYAEPKAAGLVNETTIMSSIDVVASLVGWIGLETPDGYVADGENLSAVMLGLSTGQRSGPLYWRRPPDRPGAPGTPRPDLAIRDQEWKLVCAIDGSKTRLFHLGRDESETNDVSSSHPKITERLKSLVLGWNASLPIDGVAK